ncbi:hypothetical protein R1flu_025541 [Riccia fluitans]|uniref:PHD-type zinc finger plants domain-containing protein n=1 Tax=Riccia fluitans TaxID=41844 RepID=A0ABD1XY26_9MARC
MWRSKKKEEQVLTIFSFGYRCEEKYGAVHVDSRQECCMCGDVGFPDHLLQCSRCIFRFQHSYCCNSTEGLGTGAWLCSWCQLEKETVRDDRRRSQQPPAIANAVPCTESSISDESMRALDFLLKAALNEAGIDAAGEADEGGCGQSSSVDGGSICSLSADHTLKGDNHGYGRGDAGDLICHLQGYNKQGASGIDHVEKATTTTTPESNSGGADDTKRTRKPVRASSRSKSLQQQKRRHRSHVELQQCASLVQLKRSSSLKCRGKSRSVCNPPKTFVRNYKFLSDISC